MKKNVINVTTQNHNYIERGGILDSYLDEIKKYPLLTAEEERNLLINYFKTHDEKYKTKLINCNLRFVYAVAKRYTNDASKVLDLVNQGSIGLITAINKFDINQNIRFLSYAVWFIRKEITDYINGSCQFIKRTNMNKLLPKINKFKNKFFAENGRYPITEEIRENLKDEFNLTIKDNAYIYDIETISINNNIDDDTTFEDYHDFTEYSSSINDYENIIDKEYAKNFISKLFNQLSENEKKTISMLYGIAPYNREYSFDDIAIEMKYSKERIRQFERSALIKMKYHFQK